MWRRRISRRRGFAARWGILSALEQSGHRLLLLVGLGATVLAFSAVGRPLLAMLRPADSRRDPSRALGNEQLVLALCGVCVVYFGIAPIVSDGDLTGRLIGWIEVALASLRS